MAIGWGRGFGPGMQRPVQQTVVTKQRPAVASKPAASSAKLPAQKEGEFQSWYAKWADKAGLDPNPDDPRHKYDYRAAFNSGVEPKIDATDGRYHWPSQFKAADHPNRYVNGVDTITGKRVQAPVGKPSAESVPKTSAKPQAEVAVDVPAPDWDKDPEWKDLPSTEEWIRAVTVNMNEASPGSSRRDKEGNLKVYIAPELARKGFDARELSGVTVHDHPEDFAEILAAEPKQREALAAQKIARYTDWVDEKVADPAVRLMLRDTAFHRGPTGAARIVQRAVGADVDGKWGPKTDAKVAEAMQDPAKFLEAITKARIAYDRPQFGDTEQWPGLVNRFRRVYRNTKKISELAKARNSRVQEQLASILYDQEGS